MWCYSKHMLNTNRLGLADPSRELDISYAVSLCLIDRISIRTLDLTRVKLWSLDPPTAASVRRAFIDVHVLLVACGLRVCWGMQSGDTTPAATSPTKMGPMHGTGPDGTGRGGDKRPREETAPVRSARRNRQRRTHAASRSRPLGGCLHRSSCPFLPVCSPRPPMDLLRPGHSCPWPC